jgi:hypothetical protein
VEAGADDQARRGNRRCLLEQLANQGACWQGLETNSSMFIRTPNFLSPTRRKCCCK